jgi:hypothetical protein
LETPLAVYFPPTPPNHRASFYLRSREKEKNKKSTLKEKKCQNLAAT